MKFLMEYQERAGAFVNYVAIVSGVFSIVAGVILLVLNRKFLRLTVFISTGFFFGVVGFEIGSLVYFEFVGTDPEAKNLFWIVFGISFFLGLGASLMVLLIAPLEFMGASLIGLAGGFSLMNFFAGAVHSESVLLVCSVLFGCIAGGMSHVYKQAFQIIIIPFTGAYLVQSGFMIVMDGCLNLSSLLLGDAEKISYYLQYGWMVISCLALATSIYYHYRVYYLRRVHFDMIEDDVQLFKPQSNISIQLPTKVRGFQRKLF